MSQQFKPLLSGKVTDFNKVQYPVLASPKLDGIRAIVKDGTLLSRSLKPIRNVYISSILSIPELEGVDGELIVGSGTSELLFRTTSSGVMSTEGCPEFTYWVFDMHNRSEGFTARFAHLAHLLAKDNIPVQVKVLEHTLINTPEELAEYEEYHVGQGFEGVMIRSLDGKYKYGRSTDAEGILLKVKRFEDAEAEVVGFEERMHNANVATKNALGHTERSSHQENLVGRGDLGNLIVKDPQTGVEFSIGTGFTDEERKSIWLNQRNHLGQLVKYKYVPYGNYDKPRHPVFQGFRDGDDL